MTLMLGCSKPAGVPVESVQVTPVKAEDVLRLVREPGAKVVLVNLWATWCPPCRAEFPNVVKLAQNYRDRGLRVVLVSADSDADLPKLKQFLARQGVDFPSYIKAQNDQDFISGITTQWDGAIPTTLIYDGTGRQRNFWQGETSYAEFEKKVLEVLSQ